MAIYTYECPDCHIQQDVIRGISEAEKSYLCEQCNSMLFRVYSSPAVQFNGSGFYSTDKSK